MTEQTTAEVVPEWDMSDRLRKALTHAGISSNEMAEYLEVTRHTISNWINGRTRPPATAVKLWAMRCGVPYKWLVGEETGSGSNITRIMGDQSPSQDEILDHAKRITALRDQLHGPSHRGPIRRSDISHAATTSADARALEG